MDELAAHEDAENRICQREIYHNKLLELWSIFLPKTNY